MKAEDLGDLPIIDAHQHFWDLSLGRHPWLAPSASIPFRYGDYSALKKNYLPADYLRDAANQNVVKTIHMEAEWTPTDPVGETTWLQELHDKTGYPNAMIGQGWFDRDDIAAILSRHAENALMRSVRQKPKAAVSPDAAVPGAAGSMADPIFRDGYRLLIKHGLHFDLQTPWWHLTEAADLARDFPDTLIILNHTGLPADRSAAGLAGWREAMECFAAEPNTAVKVSGICVPEQKWTPRLNGEVVLEAIRIFGTDRCMFASNFPVDSLWASFDEIFDGFKQITSAFSDADRQKLFHDNAMKVYRPV